MSGTFLAVVNGDEREQWTIYSVDGGLDAIATFDSNSRLAVAIFSIFHITNGTARKVWQGTPEDARAGRGYVTEEPAPEIPACKYPVGTVLRHRVGQVHNRFTVIGTQLVWDYVLQINDGTVVSRHGPYVDQYFTDAPPDPYPVGSEHVVDLGLLGRQTAKVVHRDGDVVTFVVMMHQDMATVAEFEKAVVK